MPRPKRSERWSPKADDKPALERIHDRYSYATDRWDKIRQEAKTDMKHVKGDPWPDQERRARIKAKRPVIALDELGQYENQVVNEVRANPRAIKFSPVGEGANDATARFYDGKTREKWSVVTNNAGGLDVPPLDDKGVRQLDALFGKHLKDKGLSSKSVPMSRAPAKSNGVPRGVPAEYAKEAAGTEDSIPF